MTAPSAAPSLWVVLPTYNGAAYLSEQLQSIALQKRLPDGLVASDDGSSDDTLEILESFSESAGFPVTILRQPSNRGLLGNLETALTVALRQADVIAFADQDDVWHPDKLAKIERAFANPATLMWYSDAELVDADGREYSARLWQAHHLSPDPDLNQPRHLVRFLSGSTITGTAMAARSSLVRAGMPFPRPSELSGPHQFLHDGWLGLLAHLRGGIVLEPMPMTQYRQHDQQFTGMGIMYAITAVHEGRRRSLDNEAVLEEDLRLREVGRLLRRPQSLTFFGGTLPQTLVDRIDYARTRAAVVTGTENPLHLLRLRRQYDVYADGWKTLLTDTFRYVRGRVSRLRGPSAHD